MVQEHPRKEQLDVTLNDTMRIVNGYLRPTLLTYLPVLSGIAPPALRREHHTSMLIKKALLNTSHHLLHARIATAQNLSRQRLRYALVDPSAAKQHP